MGSGLRIVESGVTTVRAAVLGVWVVEVAEVGGDVWQITAPSRLRFGRLLREVGVARRSEVQRQW